MAPHVTFITLFIIFLVTLFITFTVAVNYVQQVDLHYKENALNHKTGNYRLSSVPPTTVLRRGEQFLITIMLSASYNNTKDRIRLELSSGLNPQIDKGTLFYLPISNDEIKTDQLCAKVTNVIANKIDIQINLPATMAVASWDLKISTKTTGAPQLHTFYVNQLLLVIFNPWSKQDAVYLDGDDARREYVLNEVGVIYTGSKSIRGPLVQTGKRWVYGQFSARVLPTLIALLNRWTMDFKTRSDVVKVSRALSAIVNAQDENGILVGSWPDDGKWRDGVSPYDWTNSPVIFDQYVRYGAQPVKYAQCWVFGAVLTTAMRALGIPARTTTNFYSAHDTDKSLTIDEFHDSRGVKLPKAINTDMIWNFHVWSEGYMKRSDLPAGYDGWQVLDATPQETSMGNYQLGPASIKAVKQGKVKFAYDVGFVYTEVNADKVIWLQGPTAWRKLSIDTSSVGRKIVTKMIGYDNSQDLTSEYKYPEGSLDERRVLKEAARDSNLLTIMPDHFRFK